MIKKIDHVVITAENTETLVAFYQKLGFTARDAGGRFELFAGDFKINVHKKGRELSPHAKTVTEGSADLCFEVENLADFTKGLKQSGIPVELENVERTGVRGSMTSVYLYDPAGNLLEFSEYCR